MRIVICIVLNTGTECRDLMSDSSFSSRETQQRRENLNNIFHSDFKKQPTFTNVNFDIGNSNILPLQFILFAMLSKMNEIGRDDLKSEFERK